jgi:hypothetical protein
MTDEGANDAALTTFLTQLVSYVERTAPDYAVNLRRDRVTHPIPFFGDVLTAEALTIGVNPSADEFPPGRWPATITPSALGDRLRTYFTTPDRPPHAWFTRWTDVLAPLGYSYTRNAAHIDASPRATVSMSAAPDEAAFARMLDADVRWLFRLLPLCAHARVVFVAGPATKREYLFEFLRRLAPASGFRLEPVAFATDDKRRQAPRFLRLIGHGRTLPVFSVGDSPSRRYTSAMITDFMRARATLVMNKFVSGRTGGPA